MAPLALPSALIAVSAIATENWLSTTIEAVFEGGNAVPSTSCVATLVILPAFAALSTRAWNVTLPDRPEPTEEMVKFTVCVSSKSQAIVSLEPLVASVTVEPLSSSSGTAESDHRAEP